MDRSKCFQLKLVGNEDRTTFHKKTRQEIKKMSYHTHLPGLNMIDHQRLCARQGKAYTVLLSVWQKLIDGKLDNLKLLLNQS